VASGEAPDPGYDKSNGQEAGVSVFVDRRLPEPSAGWKHNPPPGHLRSGYVGELKLANRIVTALPGEVVIHYGMAAGLRGPDVASIGPDGTIRVWDSKWRTEPRFISRSGHEQNKSLEHVVNAVRDQVKQAVESGRLLPEAGQRAVENATNRNFFVITVGTGNAHGGVVRSVQNGRYADTRSK